MSPFAQAQQASWHQVRFVNPRCEATQRLMELLARRSELQHLSRVADLAEKNAERDCEHKRSELQTAEARAFALKTGVENLSALRGALTKAEKAAADAAAEAEQMRMAVRAINDELHAVGRENVADLMCELQADHDAMRARADDAVAQLDAAAGAMRSTFAAAMALANAIDQSLNRNIRNPVTAAEILTTGSAPPLFNVPPGATPDDSSDLEQAAA